MSKDQIVQVEQVCFSIIYKKNQKSLLNKISAVIKHYMSVLSYSIIYIKQLLGYLQWGS